MAPIPVHYRVTVFDVFTLFGGWVYDEGFWSEDLAHAKFMEFVKDYRGRYPLVHTEVQSDVRCVVVGDPDDGYFIISKRLCA